MSGNEMYLDMMEEKHVQSNASQITMAIVPATRLPAQRPNKETGEALMKGTKIDDVRDDIDKERRPPVTFPSLLQVTSLSLHSLCIVSITCPVNLLPV